MIHPRVGDDPGPVSPVHACRDSGALVRGFICHGRARDPLLRHGLQGARVYRSSGLPVTSSAVDVAPMLSGLAIHIGADDASAGPDRRWPFSVAAADTVQRAARICGHLGIAAQHTLAGATTALAEHGALVL